MLRVLRAPGDVLVHLRRARDHMDRCYAEPLDLEQIAGCRGTEQVPLPPALHRDVGNDPAAYLSQRRVERAQDLLRATNLTVTEVCHAVGLSSLGSFGSRYVDDGRDVRLRAGDRPATDPDAGTVAGERRTRCAGSRAVTDPN